MQNVDALWELFMQKIAYWNQPHAAADFIAGLGFSSILECV